MKNKIQPAMLLWFLLGLFSLNSKAQNNSGEGGDIKTYLLMGDKAMPEGISVDPKTGYLYTGGMQDGSMQLTIAGKSKYFIAPGSGILLPNVLGSAIDEKRRRIWICSNDFSRTFNGTPTARVSVLSLQDGKVLKQFSVQDFPQAEGIYPFVNDVVLDKEGNAYIANSASTTIFRIAADLTAMEVLAHAFPAPPAGKKYSLNGIAISPDQRYLLSNTFIMGKEDAAALFRIDIQTGVVSLIPFEEKGTKDFSSSGGDGLLMLNDSTLLCMSISSNLLKIDLDKELKRAIIRNISQGSPAEKELIGSATIAAYQDKIYTTNAQGISLFNPAYKVQKPYKIIEIPMSLLGLK